ncbi:pyridoxal-phosphate dependent enzyme, partial [Staphylococcus hominis]|uniref:pyridoxal-phosphate dependent enzyme n=1 Tax=Staphylococcus hominis TaxID=1290 RepID=UPI00119ED845
VVDEDGGDVYVKLEYENGGGCVKEGIGLGMIEKGEKEGKIKGGDRIVEGRSGNSGIGLGFVCGGKGYKGVFSMGERMSCEGGKLLKGYGGELVLRGGCEGMKG